MSDPAAQGYLLLTLPNTTVTQIYENQSLLLAHGELKLECIALPIDPKFGYQRANPFADVSDPTKDLWLVLHVGTFELPILPSSKISVLPYQREPKVSAQSAQTALSSSGKGFTLSIPSDTSPSASVQITFPPGDTSEDEEDLETLQVVLKQYGCLKTDSGLSKEVKSTAVISDDVAALAPTSSATNTQSNPASNVTGSVPRGKQPPPPVPTRPTLPSHPSQGRFVLVDESTGTVLGELDQHLSVSEDKKLVESFGKGGKDQAVEVDFGQLEKGWVTGVTVKTVDPKDMDDWLLKGAHYLSQGILTFGKQYNSAVTSAADYCIQNTKPTAEPVKFHPAAKTGIRHVHNVSATGLNVTKKTLSVVTNTISKAVGKAAEVGTKEYETARKEFRKSAPPPPPPSRRITLGAEAEAASQKYDMEKLQEQALVDKANGIDSLNEKDPLVGSPSPPAYTSASPPANSRFQSPTSPPSTTESFKKMGKGLFVRALNAAEVVGSSLEVTLHDVISSTTDAASSAAGHKFGQEAGEATRLFGGSIRNVALVYVDVAGVGRKTLVKSGLKSAAVIAKARLEDGTEVVIAQSADGTVRIGDAGLEEDLRKAMEDTDLKGGDGYVVGNERRDVGKKAY